ncbi:MAG: hypothetical protein D1H97_10700 [Paracoccus sp. BP8]|nr:MAG: hypothetical protein D1H97_10700 [Paracoccus sp. BP8]
MSVPFPAYAATTGGPALLRRGLVLLWLVSAPVLCLLYLKIEPSPDQAQFDYMAWMATQGHPFYAGSFDMNWPGGMLLHLAAVRLFGPAPWAWHLADFLLVQAAAIAAALFLKRAGFRLAPAVALLLYPPIYVTAGGWMAGQRDIVAMGFLVMACCAMLAPPPAERRALFCAGMLVACAVLIRPTYLSVLAGLLILEGLPRGWLGQPRRHGPAARMAAILAGFGLVVLAVLAWALAMGNLDDWYQQSVLFTAQVYVAEPPMDMVQTLVVLFTRWWHWLTLCAGIGLLLWVLRDRGLRYPLWLLLGLAAAILLSYAAQRKGFGYHIAGFLPLLVMLCAVALDQTAERWRAAADPLRQRAFGAALLAMAALAVAGTGAKLASNAWLLKDVRANGIVPVTGNYDIPADDQVRLVEMIRSQTGPEERMVLYGTAYQIPYLAQRLPAYRFITPAIELMAPDFVLYDAWLEEVRTGLDRHRPRFVLIVGAPFQQSPAGLRPREAGQPVLATLLSHMGDDYAVAMQGEFGTLFRRAAD